MARRTLALAAVAAALLGTAGCGAPDELDANDDSALAAAREGLDDALDTEETIRTSPQLGRRLADRVERAPGAPSTLERLVPSLVDDENHVDGDALAAFVRYAPTDAPRALLIPAQAEVDRMIDVIDDSGADGDTKVPHARDRPLDRFIAEVERDIGDVWPSLSKELEEAL
jgi:hypothetical protein